MHRIVLAAFLVAWLGFGCIGYGALLAEFSRRFPVECHWAFAIRAGVPFGPVSAILGSMASGFTYLWSPIPVEERWGIFQATYPHLKREHFGWRARCW